MRAAPPPGSHEVKDNPVLRSAAAAAVSPHFLCGIIPIFFHSARFQFEDVAKACCDFLTKHLEPANVVGIARFAEEIGCTELNRYCREYINTHFSEVRMGSWSAGSLERQSVAVCKEKEGTTRKGFSVKNVACPENYSD